MHQTLSLLKGAVVAVAILIFNGVANAQTSASLDSMTRAIERQGYTNIHSVLIAKGNKLVYEHYFNGFNADSLHDSRSSFKSITSLLTGIAIDKGFIKNVDQKVYSFFPEYKSFANPDPRKQQITIKNLLEMRSGFDCNEWVDDGKDCESEMEQTKDWVKFSLDLPMKSDPGTVWAYTSCNPMIISGIIKNATHMSVMDFAKKYLFEPLGITHYRWTVDASGNGATAGSFFVRPQDMVKIGQMVKDDGLWQGKRIVSEKWLKESTTATIPIPDFSFTKISRSKIAIPQPAYYGYYWYNEQVKTKAYTEDVLFASGNGGQYIMIIKRLSLVVVFTQGNYNNRKAKQAFDILTKYIVPAYE
ncbi:serine hydrolase domain-containing protein [Mucilaginibacter dorajii]|uniref:Beta-lactamase-related domain-containing protein n=1 Tax=Mucilaginibacter dorajii TaxID=692994 RepID=A0ABP7P7B0_9SPHI|nr:serine hydrolase [Mucilaginibacter dorajii]MCS3736544.1 CubicO group peptidase (beta-lactamase class C family) [Mucilaginibacter dorajii]